MNKAIPGFLAAALTLAGCGKLGNPFAPVRNEKETMDITAKVRDFKEGNPTSPDNTHPHFNQGVVACEARLQGVNTIQESIATSGSSDAGFPGDERTPALIAMGDLPGNVSRCFEPADRFSDWFEDRGSDVNRPFLYTMDFDKNENTGYWEFRRDQFFPLDRDQGARKESANGADPFGNLQTGTKDGVDLGPHNYGFTLEAHANFTYTQGKGQFLVLRGDDDVWAFINGNRVIDLGGIHAAESDSVDLDARASELGLSDKSQYVLDLFFAERSVASSKLSVVTNLKLTGLKP